MAASAPQTEPPREPTMRERIQRAVAAAPVEDAAQLEIYLARLEADARQRGAVTALDIEPGVALAMEYGAPDRAKQFSEHMHDLQQQLSARAGAAGAAPRTGAAGAPAMAAPSEARAALQRLEASPEHDSRPPARPPVTAAEADDVWRDIATAQDGPDRQALVRQYLELVTDLPEEEQARRLMELNGILARSR